DNGKNFQMYSLVLANAGMASPVGTRIVTVNNGQRREGYAGSILRSGTNRLSEEVVTAFVGPGGAAPAYFDLNAFTGTGLLLNKVGTGVLAINGDNSLS